MFNITKKELNDGNLIDVLGFGTFQIDPQETADSVGSALKLGYRNIDTAARYLNESGVGQALKRSGLVREEYFVATKLANTEQGAKETTAAILQSLTDLTLDYVDLYLVHWPCPKREAFIPSYQSMEKAQKQGLIKSLGVSNFQEHHLSKLMDACETKPVLNQVECHPYFQQVELRKFHEQHNIATQAWSPLAQGKCLEDPVIVDIARTLNRTSAQIVLRWHLQIGNLVIPKSVTPKRQSENLQIFDFALDKKQMEAIGGLDRGQAGRTGFHPDHFNGFPQDFTDSPGNWKIPADKK